MNTNEENNVGTEQPQVVVVKTTAKRRPKKRRVKTPTAVKALPLPEEIMEDSKLATFTNIATNLGLLAAIFIIIFAAHHGIQRTKQATVAIVQPVEQTEEAKKEEIREAVVEEVKKVEAEVVKVEEVKEVKPVAKKIYIDRSDPYTSGGPLDLDRHGDAQKSSVAEPVAKNVTPVPNSRKIENDKNNPWNGGGSLDLDQEEQRIKYKKLTLTDSNDRQGRN